MMILQYIRQHIFAVAFAGLSVVAAYADAPILNNPGVLIMHVEKNGNLKYDLVPMEDLKEFYFKKTDKNGDESLPEYTMCVSTVYGDDFEIAGCGFDGQTSDRRLFSVEAIGSKDWEIELVNPEPLVVDYEAYGTDRDYEIASTEVWRDTFIPVLVKLRYKGDNLDVLPNYLLATWEPPYPAYKKAMLLRESNQNITYTAGGPYVEKMMKGNEATLELFISRKFVEQTVGSYEAKGIKSDMLSFNITQQNWPARAVAVKPIKIIPRANLIKTPKVVIPNLLADNLDDYTIRIPVKISEPLRYGCRLKLDYGTTQIEKYGAIVKPIEMTFLERDYELDGKTYPTTLYPTELYIPAGVTETSIDIRVTGEKVKSLFKEETYHGAGFRFLPYSKEGYAVFDAGTPKDYQDSVNKILSEQLSDNNYFLAGFRVCNGKKVPIEHIHANFTDIEWTEGSLDALFDDDETTFCHSAWTEANPRSEPYGSYIDFEFDTPVNNIYFSMTQRQSISSAMPYKMALYGSNDGENWTLFAEPECTSTKSVRWVGSAEEPFRAATPFRFLRWCVLRAGDRGQYDLTKTSRNDFWHLSELHFYMTLDAE